MAVTWPPEDTDRNRFLAVGAVVVGTLATAYFLVFALVSGALVPWSIFTVLLAATLVAVVALLLMRARRADRPDGGERAAREGRG